eukprot:3785719-Alexandrium_andersonii.AAC.1
MPISDQRLWRSQPYRDLGDGVAPVVRGPCRLELWRKRGDPELGGRWGRKVVVARSGYNSAGAGQGPEPEGGHSWAG